MYTITLNDGTKLEKLELNGNNFISGEIIADDVFEDNLLKVTIEDGETTQEYTDMVLVANRAFDGKSWFVLREKTPQEIAAEAQERKIDLLADAVTMLSATSADTKEALEMILNGVTE